MAVISEARISLLQTMPVFGGLSPEAITLLLGRAVERHCGRGDFFYHDGDSAESMYVLVTGRVSLVRERGDEHLVLKNVTPGNCFGVVALLDFAGRNTSALAVADSRALEITSEDLYGLYNVSVEQFNLLYMNVAREVCRRLRETDQRLFECWARGGYAGPG